MQVTKTLQATDNRLIIDLPVNEHYNLDAGELSLAIIELIGNTNEKEITDQELKNICSGALMAFGIK